MNCASRIESVQIPSLISCAIFLPSNLIQLKSNTTTFRVNLAETEQDQFLFLPFSPLFFSHCLNFVENKRKLNNTRGMIIA